MNEKRVEFIKEAMQNTNDNQSSITSRYCNQDKFNIVLAGSIKKEHFVKKTFIINANNLSKVKALPVLNNGRKRPQVVCIKGEIYVFGGLYDFYTFHKAIMSVEKYIPAKNTWVEIALMNDNRKGYCTCSFIDNVYCFGGCLPTENHMSSCVEFDTKIKSWRKISKMFLGKS